MITFTRFSVLVGQTFVSVRPVELDGRLIGRTTLTGADIPLTADMRTITASEHGTVASHTKSGNVHRLASAKVSSKPETLSALLKRNPWHNDNAKQARKLLLAK